MDAFREWKASWLLLRLTPHKLRSFGGLVLTIPSAIAGATVTNSVSARQRCRTKAQNRAALRHRRPSNSRSNRKSPICAALNQPGLLPRRSELLQSREIFGVVQLGGLEPPTSCSTDRRSNQLSYNCILCRPRKGVAEPGGN
jgi:hypothetical protein